MKKIDEPTTLEGVGSTGVLERVDAAMVKRLAAQTTLDLYQGWVTEGRGLLRLIAFANAVAAHEREACEKACWDQASVPSDSVNQTLHNIGVSKCARAIHERSNDQGNSAAESRPTEPKA